MEATAKKLKQAIEEVKQMRRPPMAYLHDQARKDEPALAGLRVPTSKHGKPLNGQKTKESKVQ